MVTHSRRHSNSPTATKPKIYIVEDDRCYRDLLALELPHLINCEVVGTAATAAAAVDPIHLLKADIVILDYMLDDHTADGITVCQALRRISPNVKYILLTSTNRRRLVREALHRCPQIRGMIVKSGNIVRAIADAITTLNHGGDYFCPRFTRHLSDSIRYEWEFALAPAEKQLLDHLHQGHLPPMLPELLGMNEENIEIIIANIKRKFDLEPKAGLAEVLDHAETIGLLK